MTYDELFNLEKGEVIIYHGTDNVTFKELVKDYVVIEDKNKNRKEIFLNIFVRHAKKLKRSA